MTSPRCKECFIKEMNLVMGRCNYCHTELINTLGELPLIVQALGTDPPERYEYVEPGIVYCYFYRLEREDGFFLIKTDERQWCLELNYYDNFPCLPRLKFVNSFDHFDDNPIWWPKTAFKIDPIKQLFDLSNISMRSSMFDIPQFDQTKIADYLPNKYVEIIAPQITQ